jgi:uncharacterized protein (DUF1499 family)
MMAGRSIAVDISAACGLLAILAVVLGPAGIHLGLLTPIRGFLLFCLGLVPAALLAFIFGIAGLLRASSSSPVLKWFGVVVGGVFLIIAAVLVIGARKYPPIHDITTDTSSPPQFAESVRIARMHENGVNYPDGGPSVEAMQAQAYPDLTPIVLPVPKEVALDRARRVAEQLGWKITRFDPTEGRLEAYDVSRIFMFVDDIVIRVRPSGSGSIVDIRSSSRVGQGDLGKNAARIRAFRAGLLAQR